MKVAGITCIRGGSLRGIHVVLLLILSLSTSILPFYHPFLSPATILLLLLLLYYGGAGASSNDSFSSFPSSSSSSNKWQRSGKRSRTQPGPEKKCTICGKSKVGHKKRNVMAVPVVVVERVVVGVVVASDDGGGGADSKGG